MTHHISAMTIPVLGPDGPYQSLRAETLTEVSGRPVAELSLAPGLLVDRAMAALRAVRPLPLDERITALRRAGQAFAVGDVAGMSADEYRFAVSRCSGLPMPAVRSAVETVRRAAELAFPQVQHARPIGSVNTWRDPMVMGGRALWTRRGNVLGVLAAGNHPAVHSLWLEALALGYHVAVRPSRREPLTPYRLVTALQEAGFGPERIALLPTDHATAESVVRGADLAIVYGGDDVVRTYARNPDVLAQGPGRSKILVTAEVDWREHLDTIVDSIAHDGGTACVNATAVFVEGDPLPLAQAIADRLSALPSRPPEDEKAALPVASLPVARGVDNLLRDRAAGTTPLLGGTGIVEELPDGSAVLRPAVHVLASPAAEQAGLELPFPCVWVAGWSPGAGLAPLRNTLVLTALTRRADLIEDLLADPTISNLYLGDYPTHWLAHGLPHDGYLADFLMRTKAVVRVDPVVQRPATPARAPRAEPPGYPTVAAVAWQPGAPFRIHEVRLDELRDHEVLVRMVASGICHTDIIVRDQDHPPALPAVFGHEGAGIVERVGSAVTAVKVGDRVAASFASCGTCRNCAAGRRAYCEAFIMENFGGTRRDGSPVVRMPDGTPVNANFFGQSSFAGRAVVHEDGLVVLPSDFPLALAAPLGCGIQTGAGAIFNSLAVPSGSTVAVFGCGAVGLSAIMAARAVGCPTIIAVNRGRARLARAEEFGATHLINAADEDVIGQIQAIAHGGVDFSVEATGRPAILRMAADALNVGGVCGFTGAAQLGETASLDMLGLMFGRTIRGISQGDSVPRQFLPRMIELHRQGVFPIEAMVREYPFEDINKAVEDVTAGTVIKPVLTFAPGH